MRHVLHGTEHEHRAADDEELTPGEQVGAVEAEATPADHPREDEAEWQRRRHGHRAEVADGHVAPRRAHIDGDDHRRERHDRGGQLPPGPAPPDPDLPHVIPSEIPAVDAPARAPLVHRHSRRELKEREPFVRHACRFEVLSSPA